MVSDNPTKPNVSAPTAVGSVVQYQCEPSTCPVSTLGRFAEPSHSDVSAPTPVDDAVFTQYEQSTCLVSSAESFVEPSDITFIQSDDSSLATPCAPISDESVVSSVASTGDVGGGMSVILRDTTSPMIVDEGVQDQASSPPLPDSHVDTKMAASVPPEMNAPTSSLRQLLQGDTKLRRDAVQAPVSVQLTLPLPRAADIEAIDALYDSGASKEAVSVLIARARPYDMPRAKFVMTIATGRAFEHTNIMKIANSFLKDNGNRVVQQQIQTVQIGQLSKGRSGELRVRVKTRAACEALARQEVKILGGKYKFSEFDILADRYYLDVSGVDSDFEDKLLVEGFHDHGAQPIYATFRDVSLTTGLTTATFRIYFRTTQCPGALMVDGKVCEQVVFGGRVYPALGRDAAFPSQRLGFGQRSPFALSLDSVRSPPGGTPVASAPSHSPGGKTSYADAVKRRMPLSTKPDTKDDATSVLSLDSHTDSLLTPPDSPKTRTQTDLYVSTLTNSPGTIDADKVSSSERVLLLTAPTPANLEGTTKPDSLIYKSNGKRRRKVDDFANTLRKNKPKPVTGITTSNYFTVLGQVEVNLECRRAVVGDGTPVRFQIVPHTVKVPEAVRTSMEASHFLYKNHTTVKRTKQAVPIHEAAAELEDAEETANLSLRPTCLAAADARVAALRNTIRKTNNPDALCYSASSKAPLAFNAALLAAMSENEESISEIAQLHMLNRILSASDPLTNTTFAHKWAKYFGSKLPKTRDEIFRIMAVWWKKPGVHTALRVSRALALFETMLMCTAPQLFTKDIWIQRLTGHPVVWIPALNCRLLHPNLLLTLLRSDIGKKCFDIWETIQWQGSLLDDLEYLRTCELFFPDDEAVLQLQETSGGPTLVTGPLRTEC